MTKKFSVLLFFMLSCFFLLSIHYVFAEAGKISGYAFNDYYWFLASNAEELKNENGFWFRRIYLTYDKGLSEKFSARLRFEMTSPFDFKKSDSLVPFVKDAYLKWSKVCSGCDEVLVGISSTPTWEVVEKIWGYRSVEKTPLDLYKFGSSRDFGIAFKGNLMDLLKYHLMLGNGASNKSETDKHKKILLSLGINPIETITVEVYGDVLTGPENSNVFTIQGFAAYQTKKARAGIQFVHQTRQGETEDHKLEVGSIFGVMQLMEKVAVLARFDRMFDPNPSGPKIAYIPFAANAKSNFLLAGLDLSPHKDVHIIPNVEVVIYDKPESGDKPDTDVIARVTFYYKF